MEEDNITERINVSEEEVTCNLCSKFYLSPKLVECLHSFCQICVQQHLVKEGNEYVFVCPKCLHVTKTGDSSLASLTSDLHVPRLLEVFKCHFKSVTPCTICTLEGNVGEATHRCLSCNDHLCTACSKKHTFSSLTATHRVVSLVDLRSGKYDQDIMRKQTLLCKQHNQRECDFFCNTCSGPQCTYCIITKHRDHSYIDIKDATEMKKSELLSLLQKYEELPFPGRSEVAVAQTELDILQKEENLFEKTVNEQTKLIIEKIKQQSQDCLQKAKEKFKEEQTRRQMKKDFALKRSEKRQNILHLCRTVVKYSGNEIVETIDALKKGVAALSNNEPIQDAKEMTTYKAAISFPSDDKYFTIVQVDMAESRTQKDTTKEESTQGAEINSLVLTNHEDKTASKSLSSKEIPSLKLELCNSFTTKVSTDRKQADIDSFSLRLETTLIVLDRSNAKLKLFSSNGEVFNSVYFDGKCQTFFRFIHLSAGDYIIAVDSNVLYIRTRHLKTHQTIEIMPKDSLKFKPIVANYAQDILVGNLPENDMKVYSTSGNLIRKWKSQMQGPFEFLKHAEGDRLISSNWEGTGSVTMESEKNGLLVQISGRKRLGLPWRPADGVVDKERHIIVSDPGRNEISVFSSNGSQLYCYDTSADAVLQPNCLLVNKKGLIYVSYKGGMVAVYMKSKCLT